MRERDLNQLDRRSFLTAAGAFVVALATPTEWAEAAQFDSAAAAGVRPDRLSSYISIDRGGTVTAYYGKIDGGQGLETSVAQLVAEEIDVPWDRVRVVMSDTAQCVNMGGSTAGNGLRQGGIILRQTAAEARRLLIGMASEKLGVPASELTVTDGVVHFVSDPSKRVSYGELIGARPLDAPVEYHGEAQRLTVKVRAPLKKPEEFRVIGKPYPRRDLPGKVFGTLKQVTDVKLPNMAHARMIRPPVAGAVPLTVDEKSISDIPGTQVVWIRDFLAVVAEKEWNAVKAAQRLKVTWSESHPGFPGHEKLFDHIRNAPVVARSSDSNVRAAGASQERNEGDIEEAFRRAAFVLEGEYEYPTMSHASMGPACAVADVRDDGATVYTSTQKPFDCQLGIAELLEFPPEKVRAIWMFGTGGYARDAQGDATADAALLSKHLKRPVRVQYMRLRIPCLGPERHRIGQPQPRRIRCAGQRDRL